MAGVSGEREFSCTLDASAFRIRAGEFRAVFARALRTVEAIDARTARIVLDGACEAELRDLLAREQRCCSFFEFDLVAGGDDVALRVRVPAGSEAGLAFLLGLTSAAGV
ncbi:MAG: hypothetical protein QOI71_3335 [Gaiellales bacterium]|jgi:hypothetical protein|nr:hypothetical protein [Gaiellales bacterium]